jgi:hypothetical protein
MFRVPSDRDHPTFDDTFKVGFLRWLASRKPERQEWMRRRNAAAKLAQQHQEAALRQRAAERQARKDQPPAP